MKEWVITRVISVIVTGDGVFFHKVDHCLSLQVVKECVVTRVITIRHCEW